MMGRKLDLSGLTEDEAEHVLQVVQRDMTLRKKEEARLREMKQKLDEEGSQCSLLSRQHRFNERCCIRCCSPFTFLLNPRRPCLDCRYNVCKACRTYSKQERAWLCSVCQKSRWLKTQSLEWYYNNVRRRFKRSGSAKVLKTLYRRHVAEHGAIADLTEGSVYAESIGNDGSVCDSDSTFYRQSEEHSMAETITVALRVAEEAIDDAIAKAESHSDNQEKQNEANYLQENREELIEELATTIVQKIIRRRRDLSMQPGYDLDWLPDQTSEAPDSPGSPGAQASLKASLWRSRSAFSPLTDEILHQHRQTGVSQGAQQGLKKEGGVSVPTLPTWKSVDRLDNSSMSSVLQSPDGNWRALQSTQLSRPSLLTKRKSLVFSALERESGVVSAYDEMGSDTEVEPDGAWGAALLEIRWKSTSNHLQNEPESGGRNLPPTSPAPGRCAHADTDTADSDSESLRFHKNRLSQRNRKVPLEQRRTSSARRPSIMDVNFNPEGAESSEDGLEDDGDEELRRRRKSNRKDTEGSGQSEQYSSVPDYSTMMLDILMKRRSVRQQTSPSHSDQTLDSETPDTTTPDLLTSEAVTPEPSEPEDTAAGDGAPGASGAAGSQDQELVFKLLELACQVSDTQLSSTEDELDTVDQREGAQEGKRIGEKLLELASQVSDSQLSSTEDELCVVDENEELWKEKSTREKLLELTEDERDRVEDNEGLWEEKRPGKWEREQVRGEALWAEQEGPGETPGETEAEEREQMERWEMEVETEGDETATEGGGAPFGEDWMVNVLEIKRHWERVRDSQFEPFSKTEDDDDDDDDDDEREEMEGARAIQSGRNSKEETEAGRHEELEVVRLLNMEKQTEAEIEEDSEVWQSEGDMEMEEMSVEGEEEMKESRLEDAEREIEKQREIERETLREVEGEIRTEKPEQTETERQGETEGERAEETDINRLIERDEERVGGRPSETDEDRLEGEEGEVDFGRLIDSTVKELDEMADGMIEVEGRCVDEVEKQEEVGKERVTQAVGVVPEIEGTGQIDTRMERSEVVDTEGEREMEADGVLQYYRVEVRQECETEEEMLEGRLKEHEEQRESGAAGKIERENLLEKTEEAENESEDNNAKEAPDESAPSVREEYLSPEDIQKDGYNNLDLEHNLQFISSLLQQKYSAVSLRSITTEVLKVLNATEDLIQGATEDGLAPPEQKDGPVLPRTEARKLDEQLSRLEENVYVAAGTVYGLEAELGDLEACARSISGATTERELAHLEDQVASAAAQVQQSNLQVSDISARIAALKNAGLNVAPQMHFSSKFKTKSKPETIDSSRQQRRRLPAPPTKDKGSE